MPHQSRNNFSVAHLMLFLGAIVLTLSGCAKNDTGWIQPGKTTVADVRAQWGEPNRHAPSQVRPQSKILDYSNGCSFQIDRDTVITLACDPEDQEVHLQYWLHKWVGKVQKRESIIGPIGQHGRKVFQISVPSEGLAVIYESTTDRVIRVVRHVH